MPENGRILQVGKFPGKPLGFFSGPSEEFQTDSFKDSMQGKSAHGDEVYLRATDIIDWSHPEVFAQAKALAVPGNPIETARSCFQFVRDTIQHRRDFERNPVTCRASDVLRHGTGYCYAKSHLLAALLRANGLPAGFCYQRLSVNDTGPPFCLHGFNGVFLPGFGWYRIDARGNRPGIDARFAPPEVHLAFPLQLAEEVEFENVLADPLEIVVDSLNESTSWMDALARLPDIASGGFGELGLVVRCRGKG